MITKRRRILIIVLIISMVLSTSVYGEPSSWSESFVKSMLLEGLASEELLDSDKLQQPITREEFAELTVILYARATNTPIEELVQWNPFHDTDNKMVAKAYNIGIVSGTGKDSSDRLLFSPTSKVTRQEIAVMLVKELKLLGVDVTSPENIDFIDEDLIATWAYNSVSFATEIGILSGVGDNQVAPTANATREQALVLLNKMAVKYSWIDNKITVPIFNSGNSTTKDGFSVPYYDRTQLRAYKTNVGVNFAISKLVDSYKIDIKKQQNDLINIMLNSSTVSYDAFVEIRKRILSCYDTSSKKFIPQDTVYVDVSNGNVSYYAISGSYVKISVDTEFVVEYVRK